LLISNWIITGWCCRKYSLKKSDRPYFCWRGSGLLYWYRPSAKDKFIWHIVKINRQYVKEINEIDEGIAICGYIYRKEIIRIRDFLLQRQKKIFSITIIKHKTSVCV